MCSEGEAFVGFRWTMTATCSGVGGSFGQFPSEGFFYVVGITS